MPSTTRGSILISTANDIGEALVEKLGGVGYSPNEWKEKYNLCGIAPIDSAPALSVLADSAGTGDERGSILIATADAIGAILNKKYNVLRGFKPKEWASACRKMKALEEGSVASASVCSFEDGADDVPTKSLVVTIPPTLSGVSEVTETQIEGKDYLNGATVVQGGFNIINGNNYATTTRLRTDNYIAITSGSYTIENDQSYEYVVYVYDETNAFIDAESIKTWQTYGTAFSISGNRHIRIGWRKSNNSTITADEISGYHCYKVGTKTTYTANLGRTIYGGTADIVNGTGTDENGNDFTFDGQEVPTRLGYNAFWSDSGDTAVEYYQAPTPYTRKTATGGIANFSDQRTDLPLTKAIANIAPSIAGKSAVNLYRQRKNLVDIENGAEITRNQLNSNVAPIFNAFLQGKTGGYTISGKTVQTVSDDANFISIRINYTDGTQSENVLIYRGDGHSSGGISGDFYIASNTAKTIDSIVFGGNTGTAKCGFENWQLEVGSSASAYVPYQAPTTYTAELGETVYGGSVDFVSGAKSVSFARVDMGSLTWQYDSANTRFFTVDLTSVIKRGSSGWITDLAVDPTYTVASGTANDKTISEYATTGYIYIKDTDYTDPNVFKTSLSSKYLTYPLATPTESAIPGRVISPIEGVNNYWNDAGGDTEIQYFEDEA